VAYLILTSAEIMVSIVCLEFAYTQSPPKMKSLIMGVYFLGVSLGNFYVSGVNIAMEAMKDEATGATPLDGANYYWFFAGLMLAAFFAYLVWATTYKGETYIQGEEETEIIEARAEAEGSDPR
jgi:POT family proton-dependent oligopeptide transporter